jgi:hypothetical protein
MLEDCLWVVADQVGVPIYDFDFRRFFNCRTPYRAFSAIAGIARIGAFSDYPAFFEACREEGIDLVHSPEDYVKCTSLPHWYPLIVTHTPRSKWYDGVPSFAEIEEDFELPVFVKGSRQTSKHTAAASIVSSRDDFEHAASIFKSDPILRWQKFVCREFVELRPIPGGSEDRIPSSYEFRTFWWRGTFVGGGRYWHEAENYAWTDTERVEALAVARHAVDTLECAFLVVDLAQKTDGNWIIIECNDGMESGYAGVSPFALWQNIVGLEKEAAK